MFAILYTLNSDDIVIKYRFISLKNFEVNLPTYPDPNANLPRPWGKLVKIFFFFENLLLRNHTTLFHFIGLKLCLRL